MASKRSSNSACSGCAISQPLRGVDDARLLARRHRIGGLIEAGAGLDLDEGEQIALARHQVDLAIGRAEAFCEDAVAFGDQKGGGAAFGRKPGAEGRDPLGRGDLRGRFGGEAPSVFAIAASGFFLASSSARA